MSLSLLERLKWWIFPGINLHARHRFRLVPARIGRGTPGSGRQVLDAGCGNGMLSWQAWRRGNRAIGVTIKRKEAMAARRLFNEHLGIPEKELTFIVHNLYDTKALLARHGAFDEIVCADVIEHIRDDRGICGAFHMLLKPGGILHLTTPNAVHPYNASFPLDATESGGHVRPGYTPETYRELLEPLGFIVEEVTGFGGPLRQGFNRRIKEAQLRFGAWAGVPLFLFGWPWIWLDPPRPRVPFSLYARARRAGVSGEAVKGIGPCESTGGRASAGV